MKRSLEIRNKKAGYEYFLSQTFVCGIILTGTEIKSIRQGKASLTDSWCIFKNEALWVHNLHISEYKEGSYNNHEPRRDRKLLMKKRELGRLQTKLKEKGFTLIPTRLFINERSFAKLEIALARGKKKYDKRDTIKQKDMKRELDRNYNTR